MVSVKISGGDKLKAALDAMARKIGKSSSVKVGFLEGKTYTGGTPVAAVAAFQEFGTPNAQFPIPPRPYFRTMVAKESPHWGQDIADGLEANGMDAKITLEQFGLQVEGELRQSIIDLQSPKLSEVTLLLRKKRRADPDFKVNRRKVIEAIAEVKAGKTSGLSGTAAKPLIDPVGADSGLLLKSVASEVS